MKICIKCSIDKLLSEFEIRNDSGKYRNMCVICRKIERRIYYAKNKQKINKKCQEYYGANKDKIISKQNEYKNNKYKTDINFALRSILSTTIRNRLKANNSSKCRSSILAFLPYTIKELCLYLESQFEPWMNWDNRGKYNSKIWNDNDKSTWTWQLDHIIPQSLLPYDSMSHPNFQKCWDLNNLRPYNSKQNLLDGSNRIRH